MMESIVTNLFNTLQKELDIYKGLFSLLKREEKLLTHISLDEFSDCLKAKEILILKMHTLEECRIQLTKTLAEKLRLPLKEITLSYLSHAMEEPFSSAFRSLKASFSSLVSDIKSVNKMNSQLLQHYLHIIQSSLSVLNGLVSPSPTYLDTGEFNHKDQKGRVIYGKI